MGRKNVQQSSCCCNEVWHDPHDWSSYLGTACFPANCFEATKVTDACVCMQKNNKHATGTKSAAAAKLELGRWRMLAKPSPLAPESN